MNRPVQVYSAESQTRHVFQVFAAMIGGLRRSRYVAYRLARRNILSQYSRSYLGFFWDFADPLVLGLVFYFLRATDVFSTGDTGIPYSLYIIYGLLIYQTFVNATMQTVNVLHSQRGLITQQKLPPEALLLSVLFQTGFMSLFRITVMLLFSLALGVYSIPGILKFIAAFPLLIFAGMAIGVFCAPFNAIYSDIGRFVGMVLVPLRFISPVFFVLPDTGGYALLNALNPFALLLTNLRLLATQDAVMHLGLTAAHCGILLIVGLVGWFIFHVSVPVLAERA